jgi:hypothetical protein
VSAENGGTVLSVGTTGGGAGGAGTTDPASSVPGAAGNDGAVISVGATGGGASSATPRFAANSAAAKTIQPMRFIGFLPVPWSSFIAFPV